jgi:hypothetical protein
MVFLAAHVGVKIPRERKRAESTASSKPGFSQPTAKGSDGMRLKLVLIASLVSAIVGSGLSIAFILWKSSSLKALYAPGILISSTLILPIATVVVAAIFVYRHTARHRRTQALLTGILAAFLSLALFILASVLTSRPTSPQPPPAAPQNVG